MSFINFLSGVEKTTSILVFSYLTKLTLLKKVNKTRLMIYLVFTIFVFTIMFLIFNPIPNNSDKECINYLLISNNQTPNDKEQLHILLNDYDDYDINKNKIMIFTIINSSYPPIARISNNISNTPIWFFHDGSTISGYIIDADRIKKEVDSCV